MYLRSQYQLEQMQYKIASAPSVTGSVFNAKMQIIFGTVCQRNKWQKNKAELTGTQTYGEEIKKDFVSLSKRLEGNTVRRE